MGMIPARKLRSPKLLIAVRERAAIAPRTITLAEKQAQLRLKVSLRAGRVGRFSNFGFAIP
jgi:hypothetical protein